MVWNMPIYSYRIESKKTPKGLKCDGLTLYEACKQTIGVKDSIVVRQGKLVAFFCSYNDIVCAGFGALPYEREAITNFHLGV